VQGSINRCTSFVSAHTDTHNTAHQHGGAGQAKSKRSNDAWRAACSPFLLPLEQQRYASSVLISVCKMMWSVLLKQLRWGPATGFVRLASAEQVVR
jgi:hypothetical protein